MANNNATSDTTLKVNTEELTQVCSSWNDMVLSMDLGSLDLNGEFSALTENGVGVNYITSLKNALERSEKLAINITKLIETSATDQANTDSRGAKDAGSNTYGNSNYDRGKPSGGSDTGSKGEDTTNDAVAAVESADTGEYDVTNQDENVDINTEGETVEIELESNEKIEMVEVFQSIASDELISQLFDSNYSSKIKETILMSPNIGADLKAKIAEMDENEVAVALQDMFVSGKTISDFSKLVISIFDVDLKNNLENSTVYDSADKITKIYKHLVTQDEFQDMLKEIYLGVSEIEAVDENVIVFTRTFIDFLAISNNVSYEEILSDEKYKSYLLEGMEDISKSFSVMAATKAGGDETASKLYSNIIVKEG